MQALHSVTLLTVLAFLAHSMTSACVLPFLFSLPIKPSNRSLILFSLNKTREALQIPLNVFSCPRAWVRYWHNAVSYDQMTHVVSISLSLNPDMYGRLHAEKRHRIWLYYLCSQSFLYLRSLSAPTSWVEMCNDLLAFLWKETTNQISLEMVREQILITFAFSC